MDKQLGRVMREINNLGLDENTIIVLWGDHGWHLGDHGMWTKHTNYEQSTRIPIIIKAPGITREGIVCNQTVETVDLFPTLADLAHLERKVPYQELDGKSLTPLLKDPSNPVKDHIYHTYIRQGYIGEAIRNKRYRIIRWSHLKEEKERVYELYDYDNDPQERVNIANKNQEVVNKMSELLERYPAPKSPK